MTLKPALVQATEVAPAAGMVEGSGAEIEGLGQFGGPTGVTIVDANIRVSGGRPGLLFNTPEAGREGPTSRVRSSGIA
ncbi:MULTISPECIES: hypothetical protein [unclassified Methylobacterium]|uniref:hypothetical protein n=1 Tax=unclassified Methylobacterium TaxID=2615210 RepID=UPI0003495742|nr:MULTISPECIES: hypothetical protein [unclassified Methylobacterium]